MGPVRAMRKADRDAPPRLDKAGSGTFERGMVEEAKIHCAQEHFKAINTDSVVYEVVDSYAVLIKKVMKKCPPNNPCHELGWQPFRFLP